MLSHTLKAISKSMKQLRPPHAMCPSGLVSNQNETGAHETFHNIHFLHSRVIGWDLMSCALGAWCRNHKVNRGQNQLTMYFSPFPCHWFGSSSCHVFWQNWCRNHKVNRDQNQLTLYIFSIPGSLVRSSCHVLWGPGVETTR